MKLEDEVSPVLDVHPPHGPTHGVRDFFLHIFTITIGLLIALSLEGLVEWRHHRHLVHEAEASLHAEVVTNAKGMSDSLDDLHKQQAALKHDVVVLNYIIKNHKPPEHSSMEITFHIRGFENVSWKSAQSTGALAYMPYEEAKDYSNIYEAQAQLQAVESQAARDAAVALGPFLNGDKGDSDPTQGEAQTIREKIEVLQGQLLVVDSFMKGLNDSYERYLKSHPS